MVYTNIQRFRIRGMNMMNGKPYYLAAGLTWGGSRWQSKLKHYYQLQNMQGVLLDVMTIKNNNVKNNSTVA